MDFNIKAIYAAINFLESCEWNSDDTIIECHRIILDLYDVLGYMQTMRAEDKV